MLPRPGEYLALINPWASPSVAVQRHPLLALFLAFLCSLPAMVLAGIAVPTSAYALLSGEAGNASSFLWMLTVCIAAPLSLHFYWVLAVQTLRLRQVPQDQRFWRACFASITCIALLLDGVGVEVSLVVITPMLAFTAWCLNRQERLPARRDGRG